MADANSMGATESSLDRVEIVVSNSVEDGLYVVVVRYGNASLSIPTSRFTFTDLRRLRSVDRPMVTDSKNPKVK